MLANGARMEGEYADGRQRGRWLCALADGRPWEQEWRDGAMIGETVRAPPTVQHPRPSTRVGSAPDI